MMIPTSTRNSLRAAFAAAALFVLPTAACGEPLDDEAVESEQTVSAQVGSPAAADRKATCALAFTDCTVHAWGNVLTPSVLSPMTECVRAAEKCGLFKGPADAGPPLSPTCGLEIADCYIKNPGNIAKCRALPCRVSTRGALKAE